MVTEKSNYTDKTVSKITEDAKQSDIQNKEGGQWSMKSKVMYMIKLKTHSTKNDEVKHTAQKIMKS